MRAARSRDTQLLLRWRRARARGRGTGASLTPSRPRGRRYELNCKSIAANLASIRGLPDLKMLGLHRNVLTWDGEQLGTWLDALGLGDLVPAFLAHNIDGARPGLREHRPALRRRGRRRLPCPPAHVAALRVRACNLRCRCSDERARAAMTGGTVFLLTEDHLKELGFNLVGDRLYFVEVLTQVASARPRAFDARVPSMHACLRCTRAFDACVHVRIFARGRVGVRSARWLRP